MTTNWVEATAELYNTLVLEVSRAFPMAMMLVAADQSLEVEQLTDVDPNWKGIKLTTSANQNVTLSTGDLVKLEGDQEGDYVVAYVLTPAAPRGWRIFLAPVGPAGEGDERMFVIKATGLLGNLVRRSVREYTVPYAQLSETLKRLNKSGAKVLSVTATTDYPSRT